MKEDAEDNEVMVAKNVQDVIALKMQYVTFLDYNVKKRCIAFYLVTCSSISWDMMIEDVRERGRKAWNVTETLTRCLIWEHFCLSHR